ncbi:MAG: T9SS type A sorting domain-containing protein, partial [Flavobacteriaceae bacterium]|nr:T9SS type A sorting domain-containing protein [Flavobacteriaceae bacterium]
GLSREMVVGFSDATTMAYDYGYDAKLFDAKSEDMYTMWEDQKMIAQAYPQITVGMEIPLVIKTTGEHSLEISAIEFTNLENQQVYLKDSYTNTYFDLTTGDAYSFTSEAGEYTDRFSIVFESHDTLSEEDVLIDGISIYYGTQNDMLYIKGLRESSKKLNLIDMSGKTVYQFGELSASQMADGLSITNISSGIYMVSVQTDTNRIINKKVIVD